MPSCAVSSCKNDNKKTKGTEIKYFGFPKDAGVAKRWITLCKRKDKINLKNACICSIHFASNAYEVSLKQQLLNYTPKTARLLRQDAVPTLELPNTFQPCLQVSPNTQMKRKRKSDERVERADKRERQAAVEEILATTINGDEISNTTESRVRAETPMGDGASSLPDNSSCCGCILEKETLKATILFLEQKLEELTKKNADLARENHVRIVTQRQVLKASLVDTTLPNAALTNPMSNQLNVTLRASSTNQG